MNKKNTIKYSHPLIGELWIDKNTQVFELIKEDKQKAEQLMLEAYKKCYGHTNPIGG